MCRDHNCTIDHVFTIDDSNDNCSDIFHDGEHGFDFNHQSHNHDQFDHDNANDNYFDLYHDGHYGFHFNSQNHHDNFDHDCGNNNFSFINKYLNCTCDNNHDSIHALANQLDAILHCVSSEYTAR